MEADLQIRCNGVKYGDRWRFDEHGRRRLTLRRIRVLVKHLPPDSATSRATGGDGFTNTDILLMDVFHGMSGQSHPARPKGDNRVPSPEREKKVRAARRRAAARRAAVEAGEIT